MRQRYVLLLVSVILPRTGRAQGGNDPSRVTVERIYNTHDFAVKSFGPSRWLNDSTYTTVQNDTGGSQLVQVDAPTGRRTVLVSARQLTPRGAGKAIAVEDYAWSADHQRLLVFTNSARVWRANTRGDYWVLDLRSGRLLKLGGASAKPSTLMFAKFSPDGGRVGYVREHNLYVESLLDSQITALTKDGSATIINGTFDWVYEEELGQRDGFRWSGDGTRIAYWQLDARGVRDFLLIDNTDSLYSFVKPVQYPKAGTTNSAARIGVVSARGGPTTWMAIPGDPRNNYLARMDWAGSSNDVAVQQLNRRQTVNTLYLCDAVTGKTRPVLVERDSAWIDLVDDLSHRSGFGPSLRWLPGDTSFVWLSERDGWRHAYVATRSGALKLVTRGAYDVGKVLRVDPAGEWMYFYASPETATEQLLYRIKLDGSGGLERVTPASVRGFHEYDISPGANWAIQTVSWWGRPPITELVRLPSHTGARSLETNEALVATLGALRQGPVEFFQVDVGDGVTLDAWLMKPPGFDSTRKYPVLFYVYGEPAGQMVLDQYGGVNWLWHLMLTQRGYIVASVDNRGTPGLRGRAWRKVVANGHFGTLRVHEQSLAARVIGRRPYVDSTRFGVWGWSGGGSTTLLLMFRAADIYKVGMAVAPVPNLHNYDTIYQERYFGLPALNEAAYHDASALYYANGLRGDLLVVHGSGDDNVHFQGTEQLINALVADNKPFTMMEYPNRTHVITEGTNTRTHLFTLLTRYLAEHLPAGPR